MFSNGRVVDGHFFLSGMHAGGPNGPVGGDDPYLQAREAFRRTIELARSCGAETSDILVLRVYLVDIEHRSHVGRARSELFGEPMPASTLLEVSAFVDPGLLVEVEAQGIIGSAQPT